jgi:hypothetical protein
MDSSVLSVVAASNFRVEVGLAGKMWNIIKERKNCKPVTIIGRRSAVGKVMMGKMTGRR